ncbi:high mobility group box domain-containing protein [Trametes elegans]|nr:high mobility group box domain-containing protein [Trametes elegans]
MASDNAAQLEYHKLQLVGSLNALAHNMRECAAIADAFVHTLNYGNPPPFAPMGANGQFPMTMVPAMPVAQDEHGRKRKARGEDADGKKRAKKPKDPNAPKRPASSYLLFQNDVRNELKAKNPTLRNNELLSAIAKMWAEMPQEQKDAYEARNRAAKDEWLAQKALYEAGGKIGSPSGVPTKAIPVPVATPSKPVAAVSPPVPAPAAAATTSEEETSVDDDSTSEPSSSGAEEATVPPPTKKSKRDAKDEGAKKEKKHKKSKA